ncbi:uncharacterized protein LOC119733910 [Patiria miniata]|uniref:Integrase catalytic domain-containing protein n=1 Tax=Patiria miniata TaxID=46514 RepID=A0A914AI33_PATMI|nr:uncharacterized protein LOC119733910 [Patiria miniata]
MDSRRPSPSRSGRSSRSVTSRSPSELARQLAKQQSRQKLLVLARAAENERARIRREAIQREASQRLASLEDEEHMRQIDFELRKAESQLESDLLLQELETQDTDLQQRELLESDRRSRTLNWVNDSVASDRDHSEAVGDDTPNIEPILATSGEPVSMSFSGSVQSNYGSVTKVGGTVTDFLGITSSTAMPRLHPASYTLACPPASVTLVQRASNSAFLYGDVGAANTNFRSVPSVLNPMSVPFTPTVVVTSVSPQPAGDGRLPSVLPSAKLGIISSPANSQTPGGENDHRNPALPAGNKLPRSPEHSQQDESGCIKSANPNLSDSSHAGTPPKNDCDCIGRKNDHESSKVSTSQARSSPAPVPSVPAPLTYGYGMLRDSLPKLDIPKFNDEHNVKQYVTFRSLWDSIMNRSECGLPEATKFAYLRGHLGGRPLAIADRNLVLGDDAYSTTMKQFQKVFGEPGRVVQGLLSQLETYSQLSNSDWAGLRDFSDEVATMVQTSKKLGFEVELRHHKYAVELASKLPERLHTDFLSKMWHRDRGLTYTVEHLSEWLERKSGPVGLILLEKSQKVKSSKGSVQKQQYGNSHRQPPRKPAFGAPPSAKTYVAKTNSPQPDRAKIGSNGSADWAAKRATCLFCQVSESGHYLETCDKFLKLNLEQKMKWLKANDRCFKCGKKHGKDCQFPKRCKECEGDHRSSLHDVATKSAAKPKGAALCTGVGTKTLSLDYERDVLIKTVPLTLYGPEGELNTFGVLDECAERTMIVPWAAKMLNIPGKEETLRVETVMGDTNWAGKCVDFAVSARGDPGQQFLITCAFTADNIQLTDYSVSADRLQSKWPHLRNLPLFSADRVKPAVLIGADIIELTLSTEVRTGPKMRSPVAVNTLFGWTVQGRQGLQYSGTIPESKQILFTACQDPEHQLHRMMDRFMTIDKLPHVNTKEVTRSKEDKLAIKILEENTERVKVDGVQRLQTPLLKKSGRELPSGTPESVRALARSHRRKMIANPAMAEYCRTYMQKLRDQGHVQCLGPVEDLTPDALQGWYIPYHVVYSSGKHRLVFNCSFTFAGQNLNEVLLAGPTLGPSLLEVLLRFRQRRVAVSGDITAMFHQIRLSPSERRAFRFLWWDEASEKWVVVEWVVLPFGAACSPCCATFALQKHARDFNQQYPLVRDTIEQETYVDNQLASRDTVEQARNLVNSTRQCLQEAGFQMVKYASSHTEAVEHLPQEARSDRHVRSLSLDQWDGDPEPALGLHWDCRSDELYHPAKLPQLGPLTKRTALRLLASQFEPLGDIAPFTARAKLIVQELWMSKLDWDEEVTSVDIQNRWQEWCSELQHIPLVRLPRCYTPFQVDTGSAKRSLHVFCDASEKLYGAVGYLRSTDEGGDVHLGFVLAKCRVAPKRQLSIPRLELMAALVGAQLSKTVRDALTVDIDDTVMWSDSTTVLTWINSDSCRYKVFVGTRIAEIQTLTEGDKWMYVNTKENPADDITRGLSVSELGKGSRWTEGPPWLLHPPDTWQCDRAPVSVPDELSVVEEKEIKKSLFCGLTAADSVVSPVADVDLCAFDNWTALVDAAGKQVYAKVNLEGGVLDPDQISEVECQLLQRAQQESFPQELVALVAGKQVHRSSRLLQLAPELDTSSKLIRVGGRLRNIQKDDSVPLEPHPVVLDPHHPVTKLLIKEVDEHFHHQVGTDQVFAHLRRRYWVLRGRSAVKGILRSCVQCQRWRKKPEVPRMADLPKCRLRLHKPPFFSTGMDCFGPMSVKVGRRDEKRWGLIFKCMTTRAVHLELVASMDTDQFLMAYRRFASRRGVPYELLSDCGTNFKGADSEIQNSLKEMEPAMVQKLSKYKVRFRFNPPNAPHFGGTWEREVRSVKGALRAVLQDRTVFEPVLHTLLVEVEGMMNSKPLGYASTDIADADPVTPNMLLMGRRDPALPMVLYDESDLRGRRSWRHSQILADQFWRQFIRSYLPAMQVRQKWQQEVGNLAVGEVVMIVDPQLTRSQWPVGKVSELLPSSDDRVRAVRVKFNFSGIRPKFLLVTVPVEFDEWCPTSDIVLKPDEHELSNAYDCFASRLKIQVKEQLNVARMRDSTITVQVPVQKQKFNKFLRDVNASLWENQRRQGGVSSNNSFSRTGAGKGLVVPNM